MNSKLPITAAPAGLIVWGGAAKIEGNISEIRGTGAWRASLIQLPAMDATGARGTKSAT